LAEALPATPRRSVANRYYFVTLAAWKGNSACALPVTQAAQALRTALRKEWHGRQLHLHLSLGHDLQVAAAKERVHRAKPHLIDVSQGNLLDGRRPDSGLDHQPAIGQRIAPGDDWS
jgi:hypothetical protein